MYLLIEFGFASLCLNSLFGYMKEKTIFKDENDNYTLRKDNATAMHLEEQLKFRHFNPDTYKFSLLRPGLWTPEMLKPWIKDAPHCKKVMFRGEWFWFQAVETEASALYKELEPKLRIYMIITFLF